MLSDGRQLRRNSLLTNTVSLLTQTSGFSQGCKSIGCSRRPQSSRRHWHVGITAWTQASRRMQCHFVTDKNPVRGHGTDRDLSATWSAKRRSGYRTYPSTSVGLKAIYSLCGLFRPLKWDVGLHWLCGRYDLSPDSRAGILSSVVRKRRTTGLGRAARRFPTGTLGDGKVNKQLEQTRRISTRAILPY